VIVAHGALDPAAVGQRARRAKAGTALQKEQPGKRFGFPARRADRTRKDLDRRAVRLRMVERNIEGVVGQHQTGNSMCHHCHRIASSIAIALWYNSTPKSRKTQE
jgi:hypothetical protein